MSSVTGPETHRWTLVLDQLCLSCLFSDLKLHAEFSKLVERLILQRSEQADSSNKKWHLFDANETQPAKNLHHPTSICHLKITMRVFNIDNPPPHWTQRQFEMDSLPLHCWPRTVDILECKSIACWNEWHNICKPAHQMEHFLHPRA